ncbi:MAG: hypothetical protein GQ574_14150 [Crocinitomix sp.]|nr:hypothetical protein [Crocinitomix sp.]
MNFYPKFILIALFALLSSCASDESKLTTILASDTYEIHFIDYHGGLAGQSSPSNASRLLSIEKTTQGVIAEYIWDERDESVKKVLSSKDLLYIEDWAFKQIKSHDANKEYNGSCMGSNTDFEIKNDELNVLIQPTELNEWAHHDLMEYLGFWEKDDFFDF